MEFLGTIAVIVVVWVVVVARASRRTERYKRYTQSSSPKARAAQSGEGKVVRVIDGDTVDVAMAEGNVRIRLYAIDCPEDGQPWGKTATAGLIKLVGKKTARIESHGEDKYGRTLGTLYVEQSDGTEMNVNERMVMLGHAWVMQAFYDHLPPERKNSLSRIENWARNKKVGLWKTPTPIPPWEWRKSN